MANFMGIVDGLPGFSDDLENPSPGDNIDFFDGGGLFASSFFDPCGGIGNPFASHSNYNSNPFGGNSDNYSDNFGSAANLPSFPSIFGRSGPNQFISLPPLSPQHQQQQQPEQQHREVYDSIPSAPHLSAFSGSGPFSQQRHHGQFSSSTGPGPGACPFAPPRHHNRPHPNNRSYWATSTHNHNSASSVHNPRLPQVAQQGGNAHGATFPFSTTSTPPLRSGPEPTSDDYFSALVTTEFSSPSLPSLNSSPPSLPPQGRPQSTNHPQPLETGDNNMPPRNNRPSEGDRTAASTRSRRMSRSSVASSTVDLTKDQRDGTSSPGFDLTMPPPTARTPRDRKRRRSNAATPSASTARRASATSTTEARRIAPLRTSRRPQIRDGPYSPFSSFSNAGKEEDDIDVLDLSGEMEGEPSKELQKHKVDNRVKLSKFQCVICMDDVTNLTVTHCGHLFCSECLHSALHIDSNKKSCPVCRTKVDIRVNYKPNQKSYFHLSLKFMTSKRKEKRPAT